jgi:methylenetetrahydrofolate dehydrogenase (NADP+)/methenyltetrahydrofolate cyclohydrolase
MELSVQKTVLNVENEILNLKTSLKKRPKVLALSDNLSPSTKKYLESLKGLSGKFNVDFEIKESKNLVSDINKFNFSKEVDSIFITKPLKNFSEIEISETINPKKDIEGISLNNIGKIVYGEEFFVPCTAEACVKILEDNVDLNSKIVAVLGRSITVGKPVSLLLQNKKRNATVINLNSKSPNPKILSKLSDILIVAVGKADFIDKSFIKENSLVIDVGINVVNGEVLGDVKKDVGDIAYLTPVPGGVGSVTSHLLIRNAFKSLLIN